MRTLKYFRYGFILLFIFLFSQCGTKKETTASNAETVLIDGSSTVYPITLEIVDLYKKSHNNIIFSVGVSGTGGGFDKFCATQININNASRKIKPKEIEACKLNDVIYRQFEVAYDGIAIVVNTENTWVDYLTVEELNQIWRKGGAKLWSEIRPYWPAQPIGLYGPGEASGTYDYFLEAILVKDTIKSEYIKSENDNLLAKGVSKSKFSIGFFGLAYFKEYQDVLKLIPIFNGEEAIIPTVQSVASGQYIPLSRPLFIYANETFCQSNTGKEFLNFYLKNASEAASKVGYVALSSEQYSKALLGL